VPTFNSSNVVPSVKMTLMMVVAMMKTRVMTGVKQVRTTFLRCSDSLERTVHCVVSLIPGKRSSNNPTVSDFGFRNHHHCIGAGIVRRAFSVDETTQ